MRSRVLACVPFVVWSVVACGSSVSGTSSGSGSDSDAGASSGGGSGSGGGLGGSGSGSGSSGGSGSGNGGSGGSGGSGSGSGSSGGSGGPIQAGSVALYSSHYTVANTPEEFGTSSAYFYRYPAPAPTGGGCTTQTSGPCSIQSCTSVASGDGGVAIAYVSAGTIQVSGVAVNGGTMTLDPSAGGPYQGVSGAVAFWSGGESIRVTAPGAAGGAPAFDTTLVAPTTVTVTEPAFVQGHVSAQLSAPLHVAWSGATAGSVTVQLTGSESGSSTVARCTFAAGAGSGDVPTAALQAIDHGTRSILISSAATQHLTPAGWAIDVALDSYAAHADGLASGVLDLP